MATVLDAGEIGRALKRIAHEIIEHNRGLDNVVLLGIPTRGAFLGERIAQFLGEIQGPVPSGTLDITQHTILSRFAPLMHDHGLLFAGHSESFLHAADLFRSLGKTVYELARQPRK